jgi:hypothetical protein
METEPAERRRETEMERVRSGRSGSSESHGVADQGAERKRR